MGNVSLYFGYGIGNNIDVFVGADLIFLPFAIYSCSKEALSISEIYHELPIFSFRETVYLSNFNYSYGIANLCAFLPDSKIYSNMGIFYEYCSNNNGNFHTLSTFLGYTIKTDIAKNRFASFTNHFHEGINLDTFYKYSWELKERSYKSHISIIGSANFWVLNFSKNYKPGYNNTIIEIKCDSN